ncbi:Crp/Fnr family transcriptional regulator [Actinocorallia longicatena]|uniref:Crp/Fnr family transcriptional regulator n=1 Tax=Actinocorallia longicatena TaxID=111803 RepID=A0ABP6QNM2_9ACTN
MASLSEAEQRDFQSAGTKVQYEHEAALLLEGGRERDLFILVDGYVKVTAAGQAGADILLAIRGPGDLVGEFSLLDEHPRTASVFAVGAVVAVRIGQSRFHGFVERHPEVYRKITNSVLAKMRSSTHYRVSSRTLDAKARLAQVLFDLAERYGEWKPDGLMIIMPLTQFELGALAAVGESTAERILKDFRDAGLVRTRYRQVLVKDLAALGAISRPEHET